MSNKSIRYIVYAIKSGLFILPVLSLLVSNSLFFPFITTKNFYFRTIVEILFFLWVFVMVFDKKYRPKLTPLLVAVSATLLFLTLATLFGENSYHSFWSNYERMEGLVGHIHLFAYFLILSSVLRTKKDWKWFFGAMVAVSIILTFYGTLQLAGEAEIHQSGTRLDATLGNSTYFAILTVFHLFMIFLFFTWWRNVWARIALALLFVFEMTIMFFTETRGAILGFLGGLFLFGVSMVFLGEKKKHRRVFLISLVVLLALVGIFILVKDQPAIKNSRVFGRLATMSFSERTIESRFTIWGMSWEGFQEHPILGWGPGNYNYVFNEYFKPELYRQEPWFDRSHNIVFDWLISAGILGFLAYWSIFGAALYMLWRGYKKGSFSRFETAAVVSLFGAYIFHNFFVFDNLTSYFAFFSVLGFINSSRAWRTKPEPPAKRGRGVNDELGFLSYIAVTFSFLLVIFSLYFVNVKPFLASRAILESLGLARQGQPVDTVLKSFDKVFSYNSFGSIEATEQLTSYASGVLSNANVPQEDKDKVLARAVEEMEKQVNADPNNARYLIFLGSLYTRAGRAEDALATLNRARELSPNKQQIYFVIADVYFSANEFDKAAAVLQQAYDLDRSFVVAGKNLALAYIGGGSVEKGEEILMDVYGTVVVADKGLLNAYARVGDYEKVKDIWLKFIEKEPTNSQNHVSLAATYLQLNEREKAIEELQEAARLNPEFEDSAMYYISEIMAGRNP